MAKETPENIATILDCANLGMSDVDIAEKLGWTNKTAARTVGRIRKKHQEKAATALQEAKTLDEYTREERLKKLEALFETTPRYKIVFNSLSVDEKAMFRDEYFAIIKSTDTLTEPEEQTLFTAILSYVLAMRALQFKHREENLYARTLAGEFDEEDPEWRRHVDDRFQKEYDSHMRKYTDMMKDLKMSRSQRLDKVRTEKKTLIDIAEELSVRTAQADAATQIEELSKLKDEELERLLENGWLYGEFVE